MQLELLITVFIFYFIGWFIMYYIGYKLGKKDGQTYIIGNDKPIQKYKDPRPTLEEGMSRLVNAMHGKEDSIEEHIVHRPTAEELEKMHEPETIKQAKEAIAETLRQEKPPEI